MQDIELQDPHTISTKKEAASDDEEAEEDDSGDDFVDTQKKKKKQKSDKPEKKSDKSDKTDKQDKKKSGKNLRSQTNLRRKPARSTGEALALLPKRAMRMQRRRRLLQKKLLPVLELSRASATTTSE